MTTQPSSDRQLPDWSCELLRTLPEEQRRHYESLCDVLEEQLRNGRPARELNDALLSEASPVRELALLNLARCWAEDRLQANVGDVELDVLNEFPALRSAPDAYREWRDWLSREASLPEPSSEEPLIPSSHVLVREIARTPMSRVFLVRNTELDRLEVFKAVRVAGLHPALRERLEFEGKRAGKIHHPALVQVFVAGSRQGWWFLIMEYMNGGSLADRLRSGSVPWAVAVRWFAGLARALEALHVKARLSHGDLKPANLMFTRMADDDEHFKIGDFGLSSELGSANGSWVLGTAGYVAPELLNRSTTGELPFDERITGDVFSLGVSLYQTLSGRLPYQTPSADCVVNPAGPLLNAYAPIESLVPGIPDVVAYVVKRACAAARSERFASAAEFARALEKCVPATSLKPTHDALATKAVDVPPQPGQGTRPVAWRKPLAASLLALICVVAMAAIFFPPSQGETPVPPIPKPRPEPPEDGGDPVPIRPTLTAGKLQKMLARGWTQEAATAVLELNESWFQALASDSQTAARQFDVLLDAAKQSACMDLFARRPESASAFSLTDQPSPLVLAKCLRDADRERDYDFANVLVQYGVRGTADRSVAAWVDNHAAFHALFRHGVFGIEQMHLSAGPKDEAFLRWADDLFVNQISQSPDTAPHLLALFLEHHQAIAKRMTANPEFAERFLRDLWPRFVRMSANPALGLVAYHGGIWDVLQLQRGDELLRNYNLAAIVVFAGADALPADREIREIAAMHMIEGYAAVLKALESPIIRKNPSFHELMKRQLPKDVFAVLCHRLTNGQSDALLAKYAKLDNKQLEADTRGQDVNRWAAEDFVPQVLYLRLTIKALSGETLYDVEKSALLVQIASDIVAYGLPQTKLDKDLVKNFQEGFNTGREIGKNAVKELLQSERLLAMSRSSQRFSGDELLNRAKELRETLRGIGETIGQRQATALLDVTTTRMFFERLVRVCENEGTLRKVDLRKVKLYRLSDGRLFAVPHGGNPTLDSPAVQRFFMERLVRLSRFGNSQQSDAEASRAYQEIVSAWWLLGGCGLIPTCQ